MPCECGGCGTLPARVTNVDRLTSLSGLIQTGQDHLKSMDDRTAVTAAPINIQASD